MSPSLMRVAFEDALLCAITEGRFTSHAQGLGPETRSALLAIAYHHPEAAPRQISDAFDAFEREQAAALLRLTVGERDAII